MIPEVVEGGRGTRLLAQGVNDTICSAHTHTIKTTAGNTPLHVGWSLSPSSFEREVERQK